MPSWRRPVPWKFSSWPPLAPPNWTTTWFSTIPTVSDILQIPCIFAALLSAISPLSISFQRSRMPTLFIVKCVCVASQRIADALGHGFFFFPLFRFPFLRYFSTFPSSFFCVSSSQSLVFLFSLLPSFGSSHPQGFTPTRTQRKGTRAVWPALRSPKICSSTRTHDSAR